MTTFVIRTADAKGFRFFTSDGVDTPDRTRAATFNSLDDARAAAPGPRWIAMDYVTAMVTGATEAPAPAAQKHKPAPAPKPRSDDRGLGVRSSQPMPVLPSGGQALAIPF